MRKIQLVVYVRLLAWAQAPDVDEKKMHCRRAAKKRKKKKSKINNIKYLLCCLFAFWLAPLPPPPRIFRVSSKLNVTFGIKKKSYILRCSFKFPDNPQYKNIKSHLIWRTSFESIRHFSSEPEPDPIPTYPFKCSLVPSVLLVEFLLPRAKEKMAERGFDSFVGQDIESVTSWLGVHGLEGLIEIFASKWLILIYILIYFILMYFNISLRSDQYITSSEIHAYSFDSCFLLIYLNHADIGMHLWKRSIYL